MRFRIHLLLTNSVLVLLISLYLVPNNWLQGLIKYGTLPVLGILLALFVWVLIRQLRRLHRVAYGKRFSKWIVLFLMSASTFQIVHEDFGYKILMDEYILTSTSMNMHLEKSVLTPTQGRYVQGEFEIVDGYIDKRPFLYPFVLSIVHDISGYRSSNAFLLNALLNGLLFLVIYLAGFHLGGRRGGVLAVLLLAGWPLLAQNVTGAGFELLNFLLLALTVFLSMSLINRPGLDKETLLILSVILLANVRYESFIFLFPVMILLAFRWSANAKLKPSWISVFAPWLLGPLFLQNRWFRSRVDLWELPGDVAQPFSFSYVPENLGHAVVYFFDWSRELPNSVLLTAGGSISLFFLLVAFAKRLTNWVKLRPRDYDVLGLWGLFLLGHLIVILAYHAGKLDSHFATRLGMPVHLILVLAPVWFLVKEKMGKRSWAFATVVAGIFILTVTAPHSSNAVYTKKNFAEREFRWAYKQLLAEPRENVLVVDSRVSHWASLQRQGIHIKQADANSDRIIESLENGTFRHIFVIQRIVFDPVDEKSTPIQSDQMQGFQLEMIAEFSSRPFHGIRLSKVKESPPSAL